jgi:hypothetical protein
MEKTILKILRTFRQCEKKNSVTEQLREVRIKMEL